MDALAEIKHLYFNTTRTTVTRDLIRAVALLKTMPTEAERERAAVYMDGLSQMRSEWAEAESRPRAGTAKKPASSAGPRQPQPRGKKPGADRRRR